MKKIYNKYLFKQKKRTASHNNRYPLNIKYTQKYFFSFSQNINLFQNLSNQTVKTLFLLNKLNQMDKKLKRICLHSVVLQ